MLYCSHMYSTSGIAGCRLLVGEGFISTTFGALLNVSSNHVTVDSLTALTSMVMHQDIVGLYAKMNVNFEQLFVSDGGTVRFGENSVRFAAITVDSLSDVYGARVEVTRFAMRRGGSLHGEGNSVAAHWFIVGGISPSGTPTNIFGILLRCSIGNTDVSSVESKSLLALSNNSVRIVGAFACSRVKGAEFVLGGQGSCEVVDGDLDFVGNSVSISLIDAPVLTPSLTKEIFALSLNFYTHALIVSGVATVRVEENAVSAIGTRSTFSSTGNLETISEVHSVGFDVGSLNVSEGSLVHVGANSVLIESRRSATLALVEAFAFRQFLPGSTLSLGGSFVIENNVVDLLSRVASNDGGYEKITEAFAVLIKLDSSDVSMFLGRSARLIASRNTVRVFAAVRVVNICSNLAAVHIALARSFRSSGALMALDGNSARATCGTPSLGVTPLEIYAVSFANEGLQSMQFDPQSRLRFSNNSVFLSNITLVHVPITCSRQHRPFLPVVELVPEGSGASVVMRGMSIVAANNTFTHVYACEGGQSPCEEAQGTATIGVNIGRSTRYDYCLTWAHEPIDSATVLW